MMLLQDVGSSVLDVPHWLYSRGGFLLCCGFSQSGSMWQVWPTPVPASSHASNDREDPAAAQPASLTSESSHHVRASLVLGTHTPPVVWSSLGWGKLKKQHKGLTYLPPAQIPKE